MQKTDETYQVKYPRSAYTWPKEARAKAVVFDDIYMHVHLADGRIVSVPIVWIPTLANASLADREKVSIGWEGHALHWDPEDGPINEDLTIASLMRYDEPQR